MINPTIKGEKRSQNHFYNTKLQRYDEIPTTSEMFERVKDVDGLKAKAFISVMFLTGARENEILNNFRVNQIREVERHGHTFIHFVNLPVSKKRADPYQFPRTVPVLKDKYHGFLSFIFAYILDEDLEDEDELFTFSDRYSRYLTEDALGMNPHRIRHIRATNLVREEGFTESMLRRFFNWSKGYTAATYVQYNTNDLEKVFIQNLNNP